MFITWHFYISIAALLAAAGVEIWTAAAATAASGNNVLLPHLICHLNPRALTKGNEESTVATQPDQHRLQQQQHHQQQVLLLRSLPRRRGELNEGT